MTIMNDKKNLILIIDDDSRNIYALSAVLKAKGYGCITAQNVNDGIKLLEENPQTGLVLMDIMMPDIDGYEAIAMIKAKEDYKNLPVIAVTAQAMNGDKERCIQAGAWDYISKPVNVNKLMTSINKFIINE
jgi:two-component system cell cycle response regulator DivK